MNYLDVENISHIYEGADKPTFEGLTLHLSKGETIAVHGPSGCGKTTLFRCLAGFENIRTGEIKIEGRVVAESSRSIPPNDRGIGVVMQNFALFPHLSLEKNIEFGLHHMAREDREARVKHLIEMTHLQACAKSYPQEVSGGQQQRAAIARAIAPQPNILLMDEPFANLDDSLKQKIKSEMTELLRENEMTTLIISHNLSELEGVIDRDISL